VSPEDLAAERRRPPVATVVVPTLGRVAALEGCLRSLGAQTIADELEVVVVDDGSGSHGPDPELPGLRTTVVRLPERRGPAAARNAGVARAQSRFVLFTDDDCEPDPHWADALVAQLRGGAEIVAGETVAAPDSGRLARATQTIVEALTWAGSDGRRLHFAPTSNLGCTARVLAELPFDERYPAAAGEDRDWCARCVAAGHEIVAVARAEVVHRPTVTLGGFLRQHVRYGRGGARYRRVRGTSMEPLRFYPGLVWLAFRRGLSVGVLVCFAQLATALGVAVERLNGADA
jgi:glycosyltransferase involved in cell wall biosynthesis